MKAAVIGGSGYLGAELLRLLASHRNLDVVSVQASSAAGSLIATAYPGLAGSYRDLVFADTDPTALAGCDVVFVALPSGHSQQVVETLVDTVGCVVDLGADFRLKDPRAYSEWYGFDHSAPELLERAVYGLPELNREALVGATLVAAPGCYVTAASLCCAPLVRAGMIEQSLIIVDGASGTSGGGKAPAAAFHHPLANESFSAYGLLTHRHTPEMEQVIGASVLFTPHLVPMTRGILTTCYARATDPASTSTDQLLEMLRAFYADEPFVEVVDESPATRATYGSNSAHITARFDPRSGQVILLGAIDNITKGGAGQALQSANVALGLDETEGLSRLGIVP